jgi:membrane protease subunit HflK
MQELLPRLRNKVITDQDGSGVLPLLQLQMDGANDATSGSNSNSNSNNQ